MGRSVNATSAYISGYDPDTRLAGVLAEWIGPDASEAERSSDLGQTYVEDGEDRWLALMHAGQHDMSHADDASLLESERSHMQEYGAQTILYIPVRTEDQLIGYVELWESRRKRDFTPEEIDVCRDIALSAAMAVKNARLYEQAQREIAERVDVETALLQRNRELLSLQAAATATASSLDRQVILDTVTWEMANLLNVDNCTILEWQRESNTVFVIAEYGAGDWFAESVQPRAFDLADYPLRSRVLSERTAWQTEDGSIVPDPAELARVEQPKSRALLALPLVFQDRVVGLVEVKDSRTDRTFNDRQVALAQMLANQAATAIENARLYEQAQREITVRKQAEEALERYAAELERSNQELQQFAYVASHDLQEPLRMVTSYLQLLQRRYEGKLDANADDFIDFAVNGASRMRELIQGLLTYSRVGTHSRALEPIDCQAILGVVLDSLQVAIAESDASVTSDSLPTVMADGTQLSQLFQNLIANAIKFRGDRRPEIHVGVEDRDTEWLFSVRDNGIGIEPAYGERIFAIFQRLHSRHEYPGTGIGLAVCKRIVERHGGRIWVESEPEKGSTFCFTLPNGKGGTILGPGGNPVSAYGEG
jgi:signal transduction histidine kinase